MYKRQVYTEVTVTKGNSTKSVKGETQQINEEQRKLLATAEVNDDVSLSVKYIPNNNLDHNPAQELAFDYHVIPAEYSVFPGGKAALNEYIDAYLSKELTLVEIDEVDLAKISFVVNSEGTVVDVDLDESTASDVVNDKLVNAFCKMPKWQPARNIDNQVVDHTMRFYISKDNQSCRINLVME